MCASNASLQGLVMISIGLVALLVATLQNRSSIRVLTAQYSAKEVEQTKMITK
jgi:hypothetical protein